MKLKELSLIAIGALSVIYTSQATQIAYEGFNYPSGTALGGQSGGTGWSDVWLGPIYGGADFSVTNGLSYTNETGGYIAGIGGAIYDHDGSSHQDYRQWFDPMTDITTTYGTNIWFSFIATYDTANGSGGGFNVFEAAGDGTAGFGAVVTGPAGGGNFVVQLRVGALGQGPAAIPALGLLTGPVNNLQSCEPGTNLVVGRLQLQAGETGPSGAAAPYTGNDRLDVWLNPSTEPTTNSLMWYSGFYAYRNYPYSSGYLGIRTGGGCQMTIDEVRIGTSYSDVVPSTAQTPNVPPTAPQLLMNPAGPVGLQFNTSEASPTNANEIGTYYTTNSGGTGVAMDCTWVGNTPASYSFTIAQPPAHGPNNFMAYLWLIPTPNGHIQALDNPNAVQLALVSDGNGNAKAVLGYYVNSSGTVQANLQTLMNGTLTAGVGGVICTIPSAPFAGTWNIRLSSDTSFTITAPDSTQASGSMASGDQANFASGVTCYIGVSPNGGSNVGNPALGYHMTVSSVLITNSSGVTINPAWAPGVVVQSDFTTGASLSALNPANWLVLANFPSCIYIMPSNSVYRAEWRNACGPTANYLTESTALGASANWSTVVPITSLLSDSTNISFVTTPYVTPAAGFFRVSIPYNP